MPRGGYRVGAGGKPTWKYGKTKTLRIPIALSEKVLEVARALDEGKDFKIVDLHSPQVESKSLNLAGISILQSKQGPVVRLADLMRAGYQIYPERMVRGIKANIDKEKKDRGDFDSILGEFI